jgi:NAD(P)-dependent dehydrogenase (short-subunit alcohol dehydrogenase family)
VNDAGVERDGAGGDRTLAESVAHEIVAAGGSAVASTDDLCGRAGCETLVARSLETFGRVDALVHNAGTILFGPVDEQPPDAVERVLAVQAVAPFWLCRAVWPSMRRAGYGRIVLTVSGVALSFVRALDDVSAYALGKGAQFGLMNSLAKEGEPYGIRVNAISPVAATRMYRGATEPGELAPELVAPAVALLASEECAWTGVVVRAADGRFSVGTFESSTEVSLGRRPAQTDVLAERLGAIVPTRTGEA